MSSTQIGYGNQVGRTREGHPIYLYTDPNSKLTSYVIVLPDGRAYFADKDGKITSKPVEATKPIAFALIGSILGFAIGGPAGALAGASIGAILGNIPQKKV